MEKSVLLDKLDVFYSEMRALITAGGVCRLDDDSVDLVIDELRSRGIWGDKQQATFERMSGGGTSKGAAFDILTDGNQQIKDVIEEMTKGGRKSAKQPR